LCYLKDRQFVGSESYNSNSEWNIQYRIGCDGVDTSQSERERGIKKDKCILYDIYSIYYICNMYMKLETRVKKKETKRYTQIQRVRESQNERERERKKGERKRREIDTGRRRESDKERKYAIPDVNHKY
jgi:hypothetical protein